MTFSPVAPKAPKEPLPPGPPEPPKSSPEKLALRGALYLLLILAIVTFFAGTGIDSSDEAGALRSTVVGATKLIIATLSAGFLACSIRR